MSKGVWTMKKLLIMSIAALMVISLCTVAFAAFQPEPKVMPYRGEEWKFDIEDKEFEKITIIPQEKTQRKVENGYVFKAQPKENKYDIILLGK